MSGNGLWVVMPVYNEARNVGSVLREWVAELRETAPGFVFCALDDGSGDDSLQILQEWMKSCPELRVISKANSGHGQTCLEGYRMALREGAQWILQLDSDGQCDPAFFKTFWKNREQHPVIYGFRKTRADGMKRLLVSRILRGIVFAMTGVWVRDLNVPYRLMRKDTLDFAGEIPGDFYLANILVAVLQKKRHGIFWIDIHFRDRLSGAGSAMKLSSLTRHLGNLCHGFRKAQTLLH